uniref:Response regulator n=1 Tax=Roseihalotalea indica TaxID=2867963 RepID=A0AA49GLK4_9BACT|nr:response regulator [Tunicatimonas sp. TK19036]
MLIDDDEITNFINEQLISEMGITQEILIAKNGKEGITLVEDRCKIRNHNCPQLILLDINMPVMNGFEFLEQYQQLDLPSSQSIILIMLTSSDNKKDIERIKLSNVIDYLSKPLTVEKLTSVMNKHFGT